MPLRIEHPPHHQPQGIGIVAFGDSRRLAPWDDTSWAFWSLNDAYAHLTKPQAGQIRLARLFEMHPPSHYNNDTLYVKDHEARLAQISERIPVILAFPNPRIPRAMLYPLEQVIAHFKRDYFMSTLAFMIPLAIMDIEADPAKHIRRLGMWGADMLLTSEYAKERACVEYWLARAEERGIEIVTPEGSPLLSAPYRYGYETEELDRRKALVAARQKDIETIIGQDQANLELVTRQLHEHRGMLSETAWAASLLTDAEHRSEQAK